MREFSIYSVSIINIIIGVIYVVQLIRKKSKPALAMWVFFTIAVAMSLFTYLKDGSFSLTDNILNSTDLLLVGTVSVAILIWGDHTTRFNRFDIGCLVAVLLIVLFWVLTQNHWVTNMLIQLILVIAYFPVVRRMLKASQNTEPFSVWILLMIAPVFSLLSSKGFLASVYAIRAIACTGLLLALMIRTEIISRKKNQQA
jgi:general stress protein CsbA